jgi:drug/metabolite transporter (DMT)-like permease
MSQQRKKAYIQLHIAVLLFGFTAILGKLILLDESPLVWHRLWISVGGLIFLRGTIAGIRKLSKQDLMRFSGIGCLVILHWLTFYGSIKIGNSASIALACLSTTTLFTSILEPIITRSKFNKIEILLGLFVIVGIYFVSQVGAFYYLAIVVGLISAFFASLFSTLNKKYIANHNTLSVSVVELSVGWLFLTAIMFFRGNLVWSTMIPSNSDWIYLFILGLLCTSVAFALSLEALKQLSAFISNLSITLEPVYGIILAVVLLHEDSQLNTKFYIGTAILLLAVALHPFLTQWDEKRKRRIRIPH